MRRAITLGALAAACLALLFVVPALRRSASTRVGDSAASAKERAELVDAHIARDPEPVPSAVPAPLDARRDSVAPNEAPAPTCLVRVVDAATKAPLPDARLWIQRADVDVDGPEWWRAMRRHNDVEPVLQGGFGDEHALDARGEVRVPRPERALVVAAALGDRHGEAELGPDDEECVVALERFHALTVEVVDRAGTPVPHALVALFWGELDPLEGTHFLPTDEHGRLFVPKLEGQIWDEGYRGPLRVTLAGGVPCEPELVELSMADQPRAPVRLVAGDFASVVVQLPDDVGRPLALEGMAYVEIDAYALDEPSLALRGGASLHLPLDAGRAVFACVGLDLPLEVTGAVVGHLSTSRELHGATQPGQTLEVLLPVAEREWTARVRVHGIDACLPGKRMAILEGEPADGHGGFSRWSREGERVELEIHGRTPRPGERWNLRISDTGNRFGANVVPVRDEASLVLDFGDVAFAPSPVLARLRVRVVDPRGEPVPEAWVQIESGNGLTCDADGRCTLDASALPARVRAVHPGWLPSEWVTALVGGDTELVLQRAARLDGRLLLPRHARTSELMLTVVGPSGAEVTTHPVLDGRFRFESCEPGAARLVVAHDGRAVAERNVELVAGETTVLPDIDLRDVLHPIALTFELASGEPWLDGHVEVRESDGELTAWTRIGPDAHATFLASRPAVDLWVAGRGARPQLFEGVRDGDHLVLPAGSAVILRLASGLALPEPPLALLVRAWGEAPEAELEPYEDIDIGPASARPDGTILLRVPYPGEYELEWFVQHLGTGVEFAIEQDEMQAIRVEDDPHAPMIDARLTAEDVARAVAAAGG
jgi:hypothetical protein